jgi:ADP-ribose pyrophosphatase
MVEKEITTISSTLVYKNKWMNVREDKIRRLDGNPGIYGVVEKKDFAAIAAIEGDYIYLVEQYRYPVEGRFWEVPQGTWEDSDIQPEELARAELKEETGLIAGDMKHIGYLYAAYGYSNQGYNIFMATGLEESEKELDLEEHGLISKKFRIKEVEEMILSNQIKDAATVAVFGLLRMKKFI